jgi:hypothetical protein
MPITVSGTEITFNDATTQSTAATGGVTSLNGQTGAITDTSVDTIGSVMFLYYAVTGTATLNTSLLLTANTTIAGSSLRYNPSSVQGNGIGALATTARQTATDYTAGGTALSGTWRTMGNFTYFQNTNQGGCNFLANWAPIMFVRVS